MISAGVLHRLPSERATEPFALLRVLPRRRFIARYAGLRLFFFCTTLNINVKTRFVILHGSMYDEVRRFGTLRCTILFLVNYYPVINRRQHYALLFVFCNFPGNFMNS